MAGHTQRSLATWQIAFLLGVIFLLVAATATFGLSAVTASIGLGATILGIINALLAPQTSEGQDQKWFLSRAKNILNVSPYLKGLTIVTWLGTLSLGGYELWKTYRTARLFTIEGVVHTAAGGAADGAVVMLNGVEPERLPVVAIDGKFSFEDVDPRLLSSPRATVGARWRGLETHVELDLHQRPRPLIIKLPPGELPLRLTYRRVDPWEIEHIIQGRVSEGVEAKLGGQPYIVPSRTFEYVRQLFRNIEYHFYEQGLRDISQDEFNRIVQSDDWRLTTTLHITYLQRAVGPREIAQLFPSVRDNALYQRIESGLPADFGFLTLDPLGCEDMPGHYLQLTLRNPELRVALIENTSSAPVELGTFMIKESDVEVFRKNSDDAKALRQKRAIGKRWFTPSILRPGEKVLIPHSLRFSYAEFSTYEEDIAARNALIKEVQKSQSNTYALEFSGVNLKFERDNLLHRLRSPLHPPLNLEDYVLGTSVLLDELMVDGVMYPLRKPKEGIRENEEEGYVLLAGDSDALPETSCPFIYTYHSEQGSWLKEGPVLYGMRKREMESSDKIRLNRFDGRILIREEEPETSFIDSMAVMAIFPDGTQKTLYPQNSLLAATDGRYLRLKEGEQIEVAFDGFTDSTNVTYFLIAKGYYISYQDGLPRD